MPLVISGNIPGHEIEYPMAIVILGGMVTSTLLNLFVVPSLYLRFGSRHKGIGYHERRQSRRAQLALRLQLLRIEVLHS